jgi:mutator protein MutT
MTDPLIVAAAVIEREGRFLLGKRPSHKRHGGFWEFPGGKLQGGELLADALCRELREELDLAVVRIGPVLAEVTDPGSPFVITFVEVEALGTPHAREHSALAWMDREALRDADLAPADRAFVVSRFGAGEGSPR